MASALNEAVEWLDRAEQAREVAGQLTDPGGPGLPPIEPVRRNATLHPEPPPIHRADLPALRAATDYPSRHR
jgi:hypothetical protein